jgi:hypothetical protein
MCGYWPQAPHPLGHLLLELTDLILILENPRVVHHVAVSHDFVWLFFISP